MPQGRPHVALWPAPSSLAAAPVIDFQNVVKVYGRGAEEVTVFNGITFHVPEGGFVALMGPSGSGKTTLLNLIAGIDRPTGGEVLVAGTRLAELSEGRLARWRGRTVGMVFQHDTLISVLNAAENVELPLLLTALSRKERRQRALTVLNVVGLHDRAWHYPHQLSVEQKQRVAIGRAIVADPKVLVIDQPTKHLDAWGAAAILTLLHRMNGDFGKTLVMATGDPQVAVRARVRYQLTTPGPASVLASP